MSTTIWFLIGGALLLVVIWRLLMPSLDKIVDQAAEGQNIDPIVQEIEKKNEGVQPTAFNHAIRRLWDSYNRPLAVALVKELAQRHESCSISQYWINQVLSVEPNMAKETFGKDFLDSHYKPEVAAKCGHVG